MNPSETNPPTNEWHPDGSWIWKADCNQTCNENSDCPFSSGHDGDENYRWCYGFNGGGTKRCIKLEETSQSQPTSTPGSQSPTNTPVQPTNTPVPGASCRAHSSGTINYDCANSCTPDRTWSSNTSCGFGKFCCRLDGSAPTSTPGTPIPTSTPGGIGGGQAPACRNNDNSAVEMTVEPNSINPGSDIKFKVRAIDTAQGMTWVGDTFEGNLEGSNCNCITVGSDGNSCAINMGGSTPGLKTCRASSTGTFTWTHYWRTCAYNANGECTTRSIEQCHNSKTFTVGIANTPTPTPLPTRTPTPTPTYYPAPAGLTDACSDDNTSVTLNWNKPVGLPDNTNYLVRFDQYTYTPWDSWMNLKIHNPAEHEDQTKVTSLSSLTINITPAVNYFWDVQTLTPNVTYDPFKSRAAGRSVACYEAGPVGWTIRTNLVCMNGEQPDETKKTRVIFALWPPDPLNFQYSQFASEDHSQLINSSERQNFVYVGLQTEEQKPLMIAGRLSHSSMMYGKWFTTEIPMVKWSRNILPNATTHTISFRAPISWCGSAEYNFDVDRNGCLSIQDALLISRALKGLDKQADGKYICPSNASYTCNGHEYFPDINEDDKVETEDYNLFYNGYNDPSTNKCN